jgi:putative flippase GtrA
MDGKRLLARWIAFNGVGAIGIGVQLAILATLVRGAGLGYLWATAIAVECTILHNFAWHERWTWRDRPSGGRGRALGRLVRFHAANGIVSLAGNLAIVRVLSGSLGVDPVASNIVAIMVCSLLNFAAGELVVFRLTTTALVLAAALPAGVSAAGPGDPAAVELKPATVQAWNAYEQRVDARYHTGSATASPFFALDAFQRGGWRERARGGEVVMQQFDRADPAAGEPDVPDGKIHHWAGAIFVPGPTAHQVVERLLRDAGRESEGYEDVIASRLLARDGDSVRVFMKLRRTKIITATYNTEHAVAYRRLGGARASARSVATKIAELAEVGTPREREKPPGSDRGFLWRLNAYWRYETVPGGVLIECESVSLSRSVPLLVRPFVTGTVEGVARESLERTLAGLRAALTRGPAR